MHFEVRRFLEGGAHLLKKSLLENFIFSADIGVIFNTLNNFQYFTFGF